MAHVVSVSTALPKHRYSQGFLSEVMLDAWEKKDFSPERLNHFHQAASVEERYLALPLEEYQRDLDFTAKNTAYISVAKNLGEQVLNDSLTAVGLVPDEVDAIFFTSTTGLAVPSMDAHIVNQLRLPRQIKRVPIFGLGCVAGVAGVARVYDYLKAWPDHIAALVSIELCSLTLQMNDLSIANIISTGLFGDGAAAILIAGENAVKTKELNSRAHIRHTMSSFFYDSEKIMGWDIGSHGFKIVLSPEVPGIARRYLRDDVDTFLGEHALKREQIDVWVSHPGGPKVIQAIEESLNLPSSALDRTRDCLARFGNLSSASVLFVLKDSIDGGDFDGGDRKGLMMAFGPGFCSELVLLAGVDQ